MERSETRDSLLGLTVEERFGDFQTVDGITLPHQWEIRYRKEPVTTPQEYQWSVTLKNIAHNTIG